MIKSFRFSNIISRFLNAICIVIFLSLFHGLFALELLRLSEYKGQNVAQWLVSEKLDGVRAYWNGERLLSRQGREIAAPSEFLALLPPFALDGELYTKRNDFENIISIVMDKNPNAKEWEKISYHIFDVPNASGGLLERLEVLQKYLEQNSKASEKIKIIDQHTLHDNTELQQLLESITNSGGEGLVVRNGTAPYERFRTQNALKVKKFIDSECTVVALNKGRGKFSELLGSITCKMGDVKFKIGSGFSDKDRRNPPKIGDIVTFKYQSLSAKGTPRFPIFMRIRRD